MGLWTMLLALLGVCPHEARYRERDSKSQVLHLVCDRCGHRVPAISRGASWVPSGAIEVKARKVPTTKANKVTPMRRAK
jgi:hypothetical protein